MTESRPNHIYCESFGKWYWRRWSKRLPFDPNQILHSLHSRPSALFLNLSSFVKCRCWCFFTFDNSPLEYGHRLQKCFWPLWLAEICCRSSAKVRKKVEQILHFQGSDFANADSIIILARSFRFRLGSFSLNEDWFNEFGANWKSDFSFASSDSESSEIIIGSDISGDRSRKNCLIWDKALSAEARWSVDGWIGAGGSDNEGSNDGGWRRGSEVFSSLANNAAMIWSLSKLFFNSVCIFS